MVEPEIVPPENEARPRVRLTHVGTLGVFGTIAALLTMFAAVGVGLLVLFGTTLFSALVAWLLWPKIFSPEFTQWVFGTPYAPFWKLFVLFLAAGAIIKMFRPLRKR
jgi:hypothetical protein